MSENPDDFYKKWHDEMLEEFAKYDCDSLEEVYEAGKRRALYSNHNVMLDDFECLVVLRGLSSIDNKIDKEIADRIRDRINEIVRKDKTYFTDLSLMTYFYENMSLIT